jgi:uncharacterized Rmd1/YagE family protein
MDGNGHPHSGRAWHLGARIDVRHLERGDVVARSPLTVRVGEHGYAVLFRYGSVVFVDVGAAEQARFIDDLGSFVKYPATEPESEETPILVDESAGDRIDPTGSILLKTLDLPRIQAAASVLSKSVVLAHYEERVASVFDRVEALARNLTGGGRRRRSKTLLREIGIVLTAQAQMVGRAEVTEKPEIVWDDPELDRLYERLAVEYELRDRDVALSRKLDLVARTAETHLELLHNRHSIRLEWYIVVLIAVEIVLIVYDIFWLR